jgi:hypothetical protein
MVQIKAQVARKIRALIGFALLVLLFSVDTGCTHGPLSHIPPFRVPLPAPPVMFACSASPNSVFPGEPITITGTAEMLNPKKHAVYSWTGQGVTGSDATAKVDTTSLAPGTYTVKGNVSEGPKAGEAVDCSATFTVKQFDPPTVSCSANPTTVRPGDTSTIMATGVSPQNRPINYTYSASAGSISGEGNTATLSTDGAPPGPIIVTCGMLDDKGQTASAQTAVEISTPLAPLHTQPLSYTCNASPARVRPGDPVELNVAPLRTGDSAQWNVAAGVLDSGGETAVVDTSHLNARTVRVTGVVLNAGQPIGECETVFTVDPKAPVVPWPTLDVVRTELREGQTEARGYVVYTYVLYRIKPSSSDDIARFKSILTAVGESYSAPEDFGQHGLEQTAGDRPAQIRPRTEVTPRGKLAEIVVPVTTSGPFTSQWLYDNYDKAFAANLLRHLNCQLANDADNCLSKLSGNGPYLISTLVRITGHPEAVLVQNLEGTSPETGGQWVTAWMAMVRRKENWTSPHTMQKTTMAFARELDRLGIALTNGQSSVTSALGFFQMGQKK